MKFFTRFSPPKSEGVEFNEPSMTEQHFKDECDINSIIAKYKQTGILPVGDRQPLFGDFAEFPTDLQSSMKMYDEAQERFLQIPSEIRKEFGNDPAQLIAWLQDEKNHAKAVEFGLIAPVHIQETVVSENKSSESPQPVDKVAQTQEP